MEDMPPARWPPPSARKPWRVVLAIVLLGLVGAGAAWKWWPGHEAEGPDQPEVRAVARDPRLTLATPYRNVHPDVKYVGDRACAACHADQCASYQHHPMGRALGPVASAPVIERYEAQAFNPFTASDPFVGPGLHYGIERRGQRVFHREWAVEPGGKLLAQREAEVQFALGSGSLARSYVVNHDGYLFESPISWFPQSGRWDLSPSYEKRNSHFGRPLTPACLFCHCTQVEPVAHTLNRYREPIFQGYTIGCERCHGPGELHVQQPRGDGEEKRPSFTIVNPARLTHALREDICQQCHLQPEQRVLARGRLPFDYRPGLPLQLFLMDFVMKEQRPDGGKFVGQVEQMAGSRCYRESREPHKLGCTSCHDPHRHPAAAEKVAFYRQRCLTCHTEQSCSEPPAQRRTRSKEDSCIACHMPRAGSVVSHASVTDHRLPRREERTGQAAPAHVLPSSLTLVPFHRGAAEVPEEEVARNLGVATIGMLDHGPSEELARDLATRALPLLDQALARDRHDATAWESKGSALWCLGRREEALAAYEKALAEEPEQESALHLAGKVALLLKRREAGRAYLERAIRLDPWRWEYFHLLGADSFQDGAWERAAGEFERSLELEPFNSTSRRKLLVECYLRLGRKDRAATAFEVLLQLSPEGRRGELRGWWEEQRR